MASSYAAAFAALSDVAIYEQAPLAHYTSFGVGGPADILAIPQTEAALASLLRFCKQENLPHLILGNGTNVIVRDGGFRGVVIKVGGALGQIRSQGPRVEAESGAGLDRLCAYVAEMGLEGLSWAAGIPGTVGGAIWMNAGANGGEIGQYVVRVWALNPAGERVELPATELRFGYRYSALQESPLVVVRAEFVLTPGDPAAIRRAMYETIERRLQRQPLTERSAGCIFKRPPGDYAGRLIDCAGCKGLAVGGAQISPKHAGFIVNRGNATARDVLELIAIVRQRVHEQFGVWLEPEVRIVGED